MLLFFTLKLVGLNLDLAKTIQSENEPNSYIKLGRTIAKIRKFVLLALRTLKIFGSMNQPIPPLSILGYCSHLVDLKHSSFSCSDLHVSS